MKARELAHQWAHKASSQGRAGNLFHEGNIIFSYGHHFPIARHYKGAVLFTRKGHSVTTAKHKSFVWGAVTHLPVFTVQDVLHDPCGDDVKDYGVEIAGLVKAAAKSRNVQAHLDGITKKVQEANDFCTRFGFKTRFTVPADCDELKEKAKASAKAEAEAAKRKQAKFDAFVQDKVKAWLAGESVTIPAGYSVVLLRATLAYEVREDGVYDLETSRGARVPLEQARLAFRFIQSKRAEGWHRNGEQFKVGNFQLDEVTNTHVKVGCHKILWPEIDRFAATQGW